MGHLCTMLGKKRKKNPYWGHAAKNSGQKRDFAILEILEFEYFPFGSFGFDPGFEQLLITGQAHQAHLAHQRQISL